MNTDTILVVISHRDQRQISAKNSSTGLQLIPFPRSKWTQPLPSHRLRCVESNHKQAINWPNPTALPNANWARRLGEWVQLCARLKTVACRVIRPKFARPPRKRCAHCHLKVSLIPVLWDCNLQKNWIKLILTKWSIIWWARNRSRCMRWSVRIVRITMDWPSRRNSSTWNGAAPFATISTWPRKFRLYQSWTNEFFDSKQRPAPPQLMPQRPADACNSTIISPPTNCITKQRQASAQVKKAFSKQFLQWIL